MKKIESGKTGRRSFLKGAAVASVAVGSGVVSTHTLAERVSAEKIKPKLRKGYQQTAHVEEYYRLARF